MLYYMYVCHKVCVRISSWNVWLLVLLYCDWSFHAFVSVLSHFSALFLGGWGLKEKKKKERNFLQGSSFLFTKLPESSTKRMMFVLSYFTNFMSSWNTFRHPCDTSYKVLSLIKALNHLITTHHSSFNSFLAL